MPIKKSAIKKTRQDQKKRLRNKLTKISFRTKIKALKEALLKGEDKNINELTSAAFSQLDKAAKKGVIHKNTAARRKSRLAKSIKASEMGTPEKKQTTKSKAKKRG
jgi:small subunit ribosomal protein S20